MAEREEEQPFQLNWSATYKVAAASQTAAKDLQGDKILLPQSALEQLLNASTRTGPSTSHTFTAFDPSNPYSVAAARQERSRFQESFQQLPHPLMFRLVNQKNGNTIYAGIREFSSNEGEAVLSPYLLEALGIQADDLKSAPIPRDAGDDVVDLTADDEDVGQDPGVRITVKAHQLPKGVYVRLRPLEAGYNPDDWKSLLERQLRASYTTLTKDALLSVRGVRGEEFRFLIDKFQPDGDGICVVDTDLEVDIEALNEEQARETLRQIAERSQSAPGTSGGSSVGQTIDIWNAVEAQVLPGDYVDYELPSWDRSRPIVIELTGIEDGREIDLFVSPKSARQRALPRDSEHIFGDFSSPKDGSKQIVIQPSNAELEGADALLISVHGYSRPDSGESDRTPRRYKLRARAGDVQGSATAPITLEQSTEHSPDEEQCRNCLQWIPKRTIVLHENFCRRNNILCPHCKGVFLKSSTEWAEHWHCPDHAEAFGSTSLSRAKHQHIQHGQHTCPACGPSSPFTYGSLPLLAQHRTTTCPHKLILCQFCHLEVPQEGDPLDPSSEAETVLTGLTAHERADGARTTDCHLCGAIVRLRDMAAHMAHHELDKAQRAAVPPPICRNALCSRTLHGVGPRGQVGAGTRMGQGPGNDLGLCSLCFAPLYVSMYDPEGKALRRRVERRYLTQLMKGCGRAGCLNEWCRSGRKHLGLEEMGTSASAALPLVKPLLDALGNSAETMHFCVDEGTQKRRKVAEMLAAEGVWDLEWCIAALEAEGGDLTKARGWLGDWAPMKNHR
ncbi:Ubiquitin fusion degradation protein [Coniochaeta hoffmannii]|uniref:Ubiquitin fusion degradation protein n=1 Tax=Coniochaeta hoffmannii TaxID=91930 RepID=A0AA38VQE1_9PEZI|nr:Ubiquitin fusion degradation protein [Coniochaeta hoffmannii]